MEINSVLTGKRGVSLPFTDFCPPLISTPGDLDDLLDRAMQQGEKNGWKRLELRGLASDTIKADPSSVYLTHTLSLKDEEDAIKAQFTANTRRNIRTAQSEGLKTERNNSLDGIGEYYRLHRLTRKRHGLPPQPFHFFRNIYQNVISRGMGSVFLAKHGGETVAGAIFFHFGEKVLFKFGASDSNFHHLRGNHIIMWEAIRKYSQEGFGDLNFGRTDMNNEGLRRFKMSWGPLEKTICYFNYDFNRKGFSPRPALIKNWHKSLFRWMPASVSKLAGSLLHKHAG